MVAGARRWGNRGRPRPHASAHQGGAACQQVASRGLLELVTLRCNNCSTVPARRAFGSSWAAGANQIPTIPDEHRRAGPLSVARRASELHRCSVFGAIPRAWSNCPGSSAQIFAANLRGWRFELRCFRPLYVRRPPAGRPGSDATPADRQVNCIAKPAAMARLIMEADSPQPPGRSWQGFSSNMHAPRPPNRLLAQEQVDAPPSTARRPRRSTRGRSPSRGPNTPCVCHTLAPRQRCQRSESWRRKAIAGICRCALATTTPVARDSSGFGRSSGKFSLAGPE